MRIHINIFLASEDASKWMAHGNTNKKTYGKKAKKKANLFKNRFRGGGEENERKMGNNVMQEMRFYGGYLVGLM